MIREVHYFDKPGNGNTGRCIEITASLVNQGHRHIVVATTAGNTGVAMARKLRDKDVNLVIVTHSAGLKEPNHCELLPENKEEMLSIEEAPLRYYAFGRS